jgi:16S rRNA processing protein RimM
VSSEGAAVANARKPAPSNDLVTIGEITRPYGVRGEVRVTPLTDDPERFHRLAECVVWEASRNERETRRITSARRHGEAVVLGFDGCATADAAAALTGRFVALPREEALPPPDGRFYPWQLEGCVVVTDDGREIGRVAGIDHAPAQDLWIVVDGGHERLIPAVPEIVVEVDLAGRRVVIRPPEGLLEL